MGKRSKKWARNKSAFDEVIGDPYAYPEPIQGHYAMLKSRSSISVAGADQSSPSPVNRARPTAVDFFVDVDGVIEDAMTTIGDNAFDTFLNTYVYEDDSKSVFNQKERAKIEQLVGNILVERKISPTTKYFTTIK
jgi:hypothetical protein